MIQSQQSYSVCSFTFLILHTSTLQTSSWLSSFLRGLSQGYEAEPYPVWVFAGSCTLWRVSRQLQKGSQREMGTGAIQFTTKDSSKSGPDLKKLLKLHSFPKPPDSAFIPSKSSKQSMLQALTTLVSSNPAHMLNLFQMWGNTLPPGPNSRFRHSWSLIGIYYFCFKECHVHYSTGD